MKGLPLNFQVLGALSLTLSLFSLSVVTRQVKSARRVKLIDSLMIEPRGTLVGMRHDYLDDQALDPVRKLFDGQDPLASKQLIDNWPIRYRGIAKLVALICLMALYVPAGLGALGVGLLFAKDLDAKVVDVPLSGRITALALVFVLSAAAFVLSLRLRNVLYGVYANYATAAACERMMRVVAGGKSDERSAFAVLSGLDRVSKTILRQAVRVSRLAPGIKGHVDRHCHLVRIYLNGVAASVARFGISDKNRDVLIHACVSISSAALSGRVLEFLPDGKLGELDVPQDDVEVDARMSSMAELAAVVVTFIGVLAAGLVVFVISGSEILSGVAVVVGVGFFAVLLPRGGESMSWLERVLPVGGK